jgi:hypothetical protein
VANASGEGEAQRDADPNAVVLEVRDRLTGGFAVQEHLAGLGLLEPTTGPSACLAVLARHLELPADTLVTNWSSRIKSVVGGTTTADAAVNLLTALFAKSTAADRTDRVKALFFDSFKALGAGPKAAIVAGKAAPEGTAFGSLSFYANHRQDDSAWVVPLLRKHPVASKYVKAITAVARIDFYGLGRRGLGLDMDDKFDAHMADVIVDALLYQPLMADERMAVALRALCAFENVRKVPFQELALNLKGQKSLIARFGYKYQLIGDFTDGLYLARLASAKSGEPEVVQIAIDAGKRIAPLAKRALAYWDKIIDAGNSTVAKTGPGSAEAEHWQSAVRERLKEVKGLSGVEKSLIAAVARATRLQAGGLPTPAALAENLKAAALQIEQLTYRLDGALAAIEKLPQPKSMTDSEEEKKGPQSEPLPPTITD